MGDEPVLSVGAFRARRAFRSTVLVAILLQILGLFWTKDSIIYLVFRGVNSGL